MTPKQLLDFKINGFSTLRDVFCLYEGEGQLSECNDMTVEQRDAYFEELAQKIIWAAGRTE